MIGESWDLVKGIEERIHHEWAFQRKGDSLFGGSTVRTGGTSGTGHIFGRRVQPGGVYRLGNNVQERCQSRELGTGEGNRSGVHQEREYKGMNTVSSVGDRGELGFGEGNRRGNTSRVGIGGR